MYTDLIWFTYIKVCKTRPNNALSNMDVTCTSVSLLVLEELKLIHTSIEVPKNDILAKINAILLLLNLICFQNNVCQLSLTPSIAN